MNATKGIFPYYTAIYPKEGPPYHLVWGLFCGVLQSRVSQKVQPDRMDGLSSQLGHFHVTELIQREGGVGGGRLIAQGDTENSSGGIDEEGEGESADGGEEQWGISEPAESGLESVMDFETEARKAKWGLTRSRKGLTRSRRKERMAEGRADDGGVKSSRRIAPNQ